MRRQRTYITLFATMALALAAPALGVQATNLVENGDFEDTTFMPPVPWQHSGVVSLDTSANVVSGNVSANLGYQGKIWQDNMFVDVAGGNYRVKFVARLIGAMDSTINLNVYENYSGAGRVISSGPIVLSTTNPNRAYSDIIVNVQSGLARISLENTGLGNILVDDVEFELDTGGSGTTPSPVITPTPLITPTPSVSPTVTVTETPTVTPTGTIGPTATPTLTPTVTPTPIAAELNVTANPSRLRVNGQQANVSPQSPVPGVFSTIRMFLYSQSGQTHTQAQAQNFSVTIKRGPGQIYGGVTSPPNQPANQQMFEVKYQPTLESGVALIEVEYVEGTTKLTGSTTIEVIATDVFYAVNPNTTGTGAQSPGPMERRMRYQKDLAN